MKVKISATSAAVRNSLKYDTIQVTREKYANFSYRAKSQSNNCGVCDTCTNTRRIIWSRDRREVVVHFGAGNGIKRLVPSFPSDFAFLLARRVRHVG